MLTIEEIQKLPAWHRLTALGQKYCLRAMASPPSRLVGVGGLLNQSGNYSSPASGHTIQWESRSGELVFVHMSELDTGTICLWDQPPAIGVVKHNKRGKRYPADWIPDYLLLTNDCFRLVECKQLKECIDLTASIPTDWVVTSEGSRNWMPATIASQAMGTEFQLFHSGLYSAALAGNLLALVRAPSIGLTERDCSLLRRVRAVVSRKPETHDTLLQMFRMLTGDLLLQSLNAGLLHGQLRIQLIGPHFLYFGSFEAAHAREREIQSAAKSDREPGALAQRFLCASASEIERAFATQAEYAAAREKGEALTSTAYRYRAAMRAATAEGAPAICAFVNRLGDRGRKPYLPDTCFTLMSQVAVKHIESTPVPELALAYAELDIAAAEQGEYLPCLETFRKTFNSVLTPEAKALITRGKRGYHAERAATDPRARCTEPRIAGLIAHFDCTPADAVSTGDAMLGKWPRPIVAPLIDNVTGFVFGRGYLFGGVSRVAPATALSDTVARVGYLPSSIAFDGGSENNNKYLARALGALGINGINRPRSAAQWGSRVERFFAALNRFLQKLAGGLANDKMGRSSDGNKKGRRQAIYEISELIRLIDEWIFDIWNNSPESDEDLSPRELLQQSRQSFPSACVPIEDDLVFRILTAIPIGEAKNGTWKRTEGLRFGGERFVSPELTAAHLSGARLHESRIDARDPTIVYAFTTLGTISCFSSGHRELLGEHSSVQLATHALFPGYEANAKVNRHDKKTKEAKLIQRTRDSARFNSGHTSSKSDGASANSPKPDPFAGIDISLLEAFPTSRAGE